MVDSVSELQNPLVLEQVMMCLVPNAEDTIWDFDMGNQWTLHASMEILCEYVISFKMDRNYLCCIQNRQFLSSIITLDVFGSEYLSYKAGTWKKKKGNLIFDSKMTPCNNLYFSALLHP